MMNPAEDDSDDDEQEFKSSPKTVSRVVVESALDFGLGGGWTGDLHLSPASFSDDNTTE